MAEPFLRWAGGKSWFIKTIDEMIKDVKIKNYYEPFLGGAAVFFSINNYKHAYLSDSNPDLINAYTQVRDNPDEVIRVLKSFKNVKEDYYFIRSQIINEPIGNAAKFIYLNQTSFNGLYRVNKKGQYNVPYGNRTKWEYDFERIQNASNSLQKVKLNCGDFSTYKYRIKDNDLVFIDPPYTVSHNENGFIEYNKNLFSLDDQVRLSKYIDYIKRKGAFYILTNAAHPTIKEIFHKPDDHMLQLDRQSLIGGRNATRGMVSEYVFTNLPWKETVI